MNDNPTAKLAFNMLQESMNSYFPLSPETWKSLLDISFFEEIKKGDVICSINDVPKYFSFVYKGLLRSYIIDDKGKEYNKNFFDEGTYPGSMVALLTNSFSLFEIQALENSLIIHIDFKAYRQLLIQANDLKLFQIYYLEKNWLIHKDAREVSIVQDDAQERYEDFLMNYSSLGARLSQFHIASHLGITPTQLSRIRKKQQ
ncbi:MAG: cyclic nucleotide-binding domain-containing protein [Campylobacteraceae bacterium]|nr:cyclic nucleotide-binding domain-containing protein [Campylobacteraceae bacterium]